MSNIVGRTTELSRQLVNSYSIPVLILVWIGVQIWFSFKYGIKIVPDSSFRYVPYAAQLAETGILTGGHDDRYISYILLIAFFLKLKLGLIAVICTQVILSGVAAVSIYKLSKAFTQGSKVAAFVTTFLFIIWKDVQYLNFYVLTESLFTSLLLITFYLLTKAKTLLHFTCVLALAITITLLRPNGFIVLLSIALYILYLDRSWLKHYKIVAIAAASFTLTLILYILDHYLLSTFTLIETYARGEVIYSSEIFAVVPDSPLLLPSDEYSPISKIILFMIWNPIYFLKLLFLKFIVFITYAKPYYSIRHILLIVTIIYPLYYFSFIFLREKSNYAPKAYMVTIICMQTAIVALTVEDWDSRFMIPILPFFFLMGIAGLRSYLKLRL